MTVTQAEILEAIRAALAAQPQQSGAMTCAELCEAMGLSVEKGRKTIKQLIAAGVMEPTKLPMLYMDGTTRLTAAYRLVKGA
jgi:predicted ArsR family transcriptional regulator